MIHGSGRLTHVPHQMEQCLSPIGMMRAWEGMRSATRRPVGFTGLLRRAIRAEVRKLDMGTEDGLIAALKSPNIATQDAARRCLIERVKLKPGRLPGSPQITAGHETLKALMTLAEPSQKAIVRARAAWTLHGIAERTHATDYLAIRLLKDEEPRLREMAVRILGKEIVARTAMSNTQSQKLGSLRRQLHISMY